MKDRFQIVKRKYWINRIESAWKERNLVWLSGVRRQMVDPEEFLARMSQKIRNERMKIECWWGHRADLRVQLGRHPAKSRIQRGPHQCRYSGAQ